MFREHPYWGGLYNQAARMVGGWIQVLVRRAGWSKVEMVLRANRLNAIKSPIEY